MTIQLDCFYSLSSPWAYFAGPQLQDIVRRHKVKLVLKPYDFQAVVPKTGGVPIRTRPEPRRTPLPAGGRSELVEGGEDARPGRERPGRDGVEPGAEVMGVGDRDRGERAAEALEGPGGQPSHRPERRHRDARRLGPGADRPVLAEGDQRGFHAERA